MNPIAILLIAVLAIFFLIVIIMLLRIFIDSILESELLLACLSGLAVVGVFTKQVVCTDYQVEEMVDSFGNATFVITYER